nr:MAG TPA: hypothetical protein [Caudoviricetes sp.]
MIPISFLFIYSGIRDRFLCPRPYIKIIPRSENNFNEKKNICAIF